MIRLAMWMLKGGWGSPWLFLAIILFGTSFWNPHALFASEIDFGKVDRETYRLYREQKWDSVLIIGKEGLKSNIDYFYLRLRMGLSYYWLTQYNRAAEHLEKAHEFNSLDVTTIQFLYYSYLEIGDKSAANGLAHSLPATVQKELLYTHTFLDYVRLEGGYTLSSDQPLQNDPYLMGGDSLFGEQDLYGNHSYAHISLGLNLLPHLTLDVAYNHLTFKKTKYYQYSYVVDQLDSTTHYDWGYLNHYSWNNTIESYYKSYRVQQNELYLEPTLHLANRLKIAPSVHFLYMTYPDLTSNYTPSTVTDTIYVDTITPALGTYTFEQAHYTFGSVHTKLLNYVISISLQKSFSIFQTSLTGSYSNLNGANQTQCSWSLTYYPFGNSNAYGYSNLIGLFEGSSSRLIFQQHLGGRVAHWMWLDGSFIYGDLTNTNLQNGKIVYNNTDKITYRIGATIDFILSKHVRLSLIYHYFRNQSLLNYDVASNTEQTTSVTTAVRYTDYHTNTIIGGLTWIF